MGGDESIETVDIQESLAYVDCVDPDYRSVCVSVGVDDTCVVALGRDKSLESTSVEMLYVLYMAVFLSRCGRKEGA